VNEAELSRLTAAGTSLDEATLAEVVACVGAPRKAVQRLAADVLAATTDATRAAAVTLLRIAAASEDPRRRWGAVYALGRLGLVDTEMVPTLLAVFDHRDGDERWAAAQLMRACARGHASLVLPLVVNAAAGGSAEQRKMALYVLRDVAPDDAGVHRAVRRGLADPEVGVRFAALSAVARLVPRPADACDLVVALAERDPDPGLRRAALSALGWVGRGVDAVAALLDAAAASDDAGVRRAAGVARRRLAEAE
jgi:HEAT repeat protein